MKTLVILALTLLSTPVFAQFGRPSAYSYRICDGTSCRVVQSATPQTFANGMMCRCDENGGNCECVPLSAGEVLVSVNGVPVNQTNRSSMYQAAPATTYQTYRSAPLIVQAPQTTVYRTYRTIRQPRLYQRSWTGPFGVTRTRTFWR